MRRLLAVLLAAAVAAAPALAVVVDAEMPPDVAARWSTLDPTKWSVSRACCAPHASAGAAPTLAAPLDLQ
jgi:hypothetical protein